jgi:hypothetical protein
MTCAKLALLGDDINSLWVSARGAKKVLGCAQDETSVWQTTMKCTVDVVCSFDRSAVTSGT